MPHSRGSRCPSWRLSGSHEMSVAHERKNVGSAVYFEVRFEICLFFRWVVLFCSRCYAPPCCSARSGMLCRRGMGARSRSNARATSHFPQHTSNRQNNFMHVHFLRLCSVYVVRTFAHLSSLRTEPSLAVFFFFSRAPRDKWTPLEQRLFMQSAETARRLSLVCPPEKKKKHASPEKKIVGRDDRRLTVGPPLAREAARARARCGRPHAGWPQPHPSRTAVWHRHAQHGVRPD